MCELCSYSAYLKNISFQGYEYDLLFGYMSEKKSVNLLTSIPLKLIYLFFHPLQVVSPYCDPQIVVDENYYYLFNLRRNICKY